MQVTIILNTDDSGDAQALARLFGQPATPAPVLHVAAAPLPPIVPADHPIADHTSSEAILQAEADRVAGRPTGAPSGGEGSPSSDSTGLPWDDRIHSTPPTQTDKGVWRKRRGVTDETFATVSAELRGGNAPAPSVAPAAPPVEPTTAPPVSTDTPVPADTASGPDVAAAAPEPVAPPPPPVVQAAPPPPPAADGAARFPTFPAFVTAMNALPGAVYAKLNEHAASVGAASFTALKDQPGLWDLFYDSWPVE
jgi:hypothetical protein